MNYRTRAALGVALLIACIAATPAPTPSVQVTPNAQVLARAQSWFHGLQVGKIDRTQLNAQVNTAMTDAIVKQLAMEIGPLGDPTLFEQVQTGMQAGSTYYIYRVTFKTGDSCDFVFAYQSDGKVSGLRIAPLQ